MAIDTIPTDVLPLPADRAVDRPTALVALWRRVLAPLASLRLTVTLFGLSIFIIFAGTGAQVNKDIWQVIEQYFRTPIAWVEFKDLIPLLFLRSDVSGGFYFPGGWLIGTLLTINLVAAHLVRFKIQATGARLAAGLAVIALGVYVTWLVITRGDAIDGLNRLAPIEWSTFWNLLLVGLASLWVAMAYALWRLPPERAVERWTLIIAGVLLGCTLAYFVIGGQSARLSDESMRILWQLTQGGLAGLVLLAGCALVFARRGGIVLLHGGVGLLMFGELWVGLKHVEGQMHIKEGEIVNFVQDIRSLELAVIDSADKEKDHVVVIPERRWLSEASGADQPVLHDDALPFDVQLVRFYRNSALRRAEAKDDNPATAGEGLRTLAVQQPQVSGTDSSGGINQSAAYLKLFKKGTTEPLGVHLVSLVQSLQDVPEKVAVDGKTYDVYLRFKRTYKDYAFQLLDFRFDRYVGTNTPKNYSSDVRVVNHQTGDDRHVKIWMNNPLRYQGETFYQQSFTTDPITNQENGTILQVVTNSGWMIPYVSCMLVATGLLGHFMLTLLRFLRGRAAQSATEFDRLAAEPASRPNEASRRDEASRRVHPGGPSRDKTPPLSESPAPTRLARWFPIVVCTVAAVGVAGQIYRAVTGRATGDPHQQFDLTAFGRIPVAYEGRIKPLDTLARNTLQKISDRETFVDDDDITQPAIRWLLDVMSDHRSAYRHKVFRIQNLELLSLLGHERRKGYRFSVDELREKFKELEKQAEQAREVKSIDQSVYQKKVIELADRLMLYLAIREAFTAEPASVRRPAAEAQFLLEASSRQEQLNRGMVPFAIPLVDGEGWEPLATAAVRLELQEFAKRRNVATPQQLAHSMAADMAEGMAAVQTQPLTPEQLSRLEQNILHATTTALKGRPLATEVHSWTGAFIEILSAYRDNKPEDFNRAVARYADLVAATNAPDLDPQRVNFESLFNGFAPFSMCQYLYLLAFLLAVLSWVGWSAPLSRAALWLTAGTLVLHTLAIVARVYISGRPPVTNLYTTAIFIGWVCAVCGFILELVYRLGFGSVVAGIAGFVTLTIGDGLAARGDTFTVMQAVLDTQFWLATHVVTINTGYAASFLGGLFGALYVLVGLVSTSDSQTGKQLARMTYGSICFGLFTSFIGTVLGGLWADDSWGRFWGWDPKENGALIIVLWNAIILHARWGGMVRDRGLAVLAVLGNIFVAWSWFGVNELGTGLHSYGFTEGVKTNLAVSVAAFLAIAAAGLIPLQYWRGFRDQTTPTAS
jgi:ABC-type transport system involved in cytochrome c biogenesis permease subunit